MSVMFIANQVVKLPIRFVEGDILDEAAATLLTIIHHRRIKARLRYLLERHEISPDELQSKANELASQELVPTVMSADDEGDADPILVEAMNIARELIIGRMAQEGLLPPKGLDIHAKALVDAMPEIYEKGRRRIEARFLSAQEMIQ